MRKLLSSTVVSVALVLVILAILFWLGGCATLHPPVPAPTPAPSPSPVPVPPPTPTPEPTPASCLDPTPGPVTVMAVKIHVQGPNWWTIDASPLVGKRVGSGCSRDWDYCRAIGFTDGRGYCPPRAEGSLDRGVCDFAVTGGGIVWTWNGRVISPSVDGVPDDHEARIDPVGGWMLQIRPGIGGVARACSKLASGCWTDTQRMDCGQVVIP